MLPLEDNFSDIVSKAMRGRQLSDSAVAERAGVEVAAVRALREGAWDEATARAVASVLGLKAAALAEAGAQSWRPAPIALEGLAHFNTPYEDLTVNSYLAWDGASGSAVAFDSGADCSEMLELLDAKKLILRLILLTHTHGDHIFDLDRLKSKTGAPAFVSEREPLEGAGSFTAGRHFTAGALEIDSRLTWGHSRGGITFVVQGLARPVAVVGDAIFAGSMGGGGIDFHAALETNRTEILTLPDDTILCPGHGPLTTIGEEKMHNPFLS